MLRQPSVPNTSPSALTISGLNTATLRSSYSATNIRIDIPTCGAARPTPFASCIVSNISSTSFCSEGSKRCTFLAFWRKIGFSEVIIFRSAIILQTPFTAGNKQTILYPDAIISLHTIIWEMPNANMLDTIRAYLEQHHLLPEQGTIVVAVSGGADSLCLLHLLHQLCGPGKQYPAVQLHVAHLKHQLRGQESERDATIVAQLARSWDLPVTIGSIGVSALARQEQRSLEDAARVARYRFLHEVAQGQLIAVAHHQDDQVETLLLHWLRGGGLASMVGLQPRQHDIILPF